MDQKEYNDIWKKISSKRKLPPNIVRTCRCDAPLWQMLEAKLNDLLKKISIANHKGKISMSLDDDKIWFGSTTSQVTDLFNLKFTTHVKANRKGIVAHTAVTTGIMIPLAIAFERTGDTCLECMKRILGGLFGCMSSFPDLRNVHIHSDRGYMYPDMVFEFLLKQGAEVLGTCKRMAQCWPFTYNQKMKENDKRTWIDVKGAPTLFLKYCKAGAKYVFASAFRNGTQSVATAISSMHKTHEWEGVAMNTSEYFAYQNDSSVLCNKFFSRVNMDGFYDKSPDDDERYVIQEFLNTKIVPYTLRQGTADWHYLRKFSLTSSQANKSFEVAMPAYKDDLSWIAVAEYLYGNSWHEALSIPEDEAPPLEQLGTDDNTGDETNIMMYLSDFTTMQQLCTSRNHDEAIFHMAIDRLKSFTGSSGDDDDNEMILGSDDAKNEYNSWNRRMQLCAKDIISSYNLHKLPMKSIGNKEMISWFQNPNAVRSIMFYTCESLKLIMKKKNLVIATGRPTLTRMIYVLSGIDVESVQRQEGSDCASIESVVLNHEDAAARAIIERSFLPHQKGPKREYSSLGHRLEIPILQKWIEKSASLGISIKGAYSTGLAAKQGEEYAKDSIDFILVVKDDGPLQAWGFEAKGRVTAATAAQEEQNLINSINPHRRIQENDVFDFVLDPGERFQLLHHAYVYNLEAVVIAIGDSQSEILRSAIVDFSAHLKLHYGNVLRKLKDISLSWAYPETPLPNNQVLDIPPKVMELASTIPTINGEETLQGTLNLWYAISGMPKPIPSLVRIIPSIYAFWNVVKGGSGTTTKLMDSCLIQIPKQYMNTESVAVTRCLMLVMVCNL